MIGGWSGGGVIQVRPGNSLWERLNGRMMLERGDRLIQPFLPRLMHSFLQSRLIYFFEPRLIYFFFAAQVDILFLAQVDALLVYKLG